MLKCAPRPGGGDSGVPSIIIRVLDVLDRPVLEHPLEELRPVDLRGRGGDLDGPLEDPEQRRLVRTKRTVRNGGRRDSRADRRCGREQQEQR